MTTNPTDPTAPIDPTDDEWAPPRVRRPVREETIIIGDTFSPDVPPWVTPPSALLPDDSPDTDEPDDDTDDSPDTNDSAPI